MPQEGLKLRRKFFDLYSDHGSWYLPVSKDLFVCPLCLRSFDRDSVETDRPKVNIAHVYPKAVGGTWKSLSCAECNSRSASLGEPAVARAHQWHEAFDGGKPIKAKFAVGDIEMGIDWSGKPTADPEKPWAFHIVRKSGRPGVAEKVVSLLQSKGTKFHISYPSVEDFGYKYSTINSVYLALFATYGYEFAVCSSSRPIRECLMHPDLLRLEKEIEIPTLECTDRLTNVPMYSAGVCYTPDAVALAVTLPSPTKEFTRRLIFVPALGDRGREDYERLSKGEASELLQVQYRPGRRLRFGMMVRDEMWRMHTDLDFAYSRTARGIDA